MTSTQPSAARRSGAWRLLVATMLALAMLAPAARPASADSAAVGVRAGESGHVMALESSADGRTYVKVSATFTGVLAGNGLQMAVACDAQGVGLVAATRVDECSIHVAGQRYDVPTVPYNAPGPVAVVAGTFATPISDITVCVSGRAVPVLGEDATARRCFDQPVTVNPGPVLEPAEETVIGVGVVEQSGRTVAYGCAAVAVPTAVSTSIVECRLDSLWSSPQVTMPGPAAATGGVAVLYTGTRPRVCYTIEARFLSGRTAQTSGCRESLLKAAALQIDRSLGGRG
jgi:hypothetical protein